jgi:hypothetical protein
VLEVCNANVRGIDKLNNNMMMFMHQLLGHLGERLPHANLPTKIAIPKALAILVASGDEEPTITKTTLILGEQTSKVDNVTGNAQSCDMAHVVSIGARVIQQ